MNVYQIILFIWLGLAALGTIASIGQPRKPITPGGACLTVVLVGALVTLVGLA